MIHVEIQRPDATCERLSFAKSEVLIGRKPSNDVVLGGLDVSGNHACLQLAEGRIVVVDLGSTNGTFVRGERVQMSPVADREEIRVAGYVLRVEAGDERTASAASEASEAALATPAGRGEPEPPPLALGDLEPPPLLAAQLGGDLPPLVAGASASAGALAEAPPLLRTLAPATSPTPAPAPVPPPGAAREAPRRPSERAVDEPTGPAPRQPGEREAAAPAGPDLAALWASPEVTRMIAREGEAVELERRGGAREHLDLPRGSLAPALAALTGLKDLSHGPCSRSLVDGAALWWARGADGRLVAALERPRAPAPALAAAIQAGALDDALALRLLDALGRGRALALVGRGGADPLPLALALAAAGRRPGALIRGHVEAIALPEGAAITLLDAAEPGARAAAIGLALRLGAAWIVVDEATTRAAAAAARRAGVSVILALTAEPDDAPLGRAGAGLDLAHLLLLAPGPRGAVIERAIDAPLNNV